MKKILEVPYLSQFDDVSDPEWKSRACGIACLVMVLGFYEGKLRPIENLIELGTDLKAYDKKYNWYDSGLCSIAGELGFTAFRRRWELSKADTAVFLDEGRSEEDNEAYNAQALKEGVYTLVETLRLGSPVIVSVSKNFNEPHKGHDIVLTGFEKDGEKLLGFIYHDPNARGEKRANEFVGIDKFLEHWKRRGIFIIKP
ncbi:MAG: papain-like cysteine protease family protein [Patescibacteria group bacterium]|nr:papain-like cysteine protease family protein [Patescibacteria group bacterium]